MAKCIHGGTKPGPNVSFPCPQCVHSQSQGDHKSRGNSKQTWAQKTGPYHQSGARSGRHWNQGKGGHYQQQQQQWTPQQEQQWAAQQQQQWAQQQQHQQRGGWNQQYQQQWMAQQQAQAAQYQGQLQGQHVPHFQLSPSASPRQHFPPLSSALATGPKQPGISGPPPKSADSAKLPSASVPADIQNVPEARSSTEPDQVVTEPETVSDAATPAAPVEVLDGAEASKEAAVLASISTAASSIELSEAELIRQKQREMARELHAEAEAVKDLSGKNTATANVMTDEEVEITGVKHPAANSEEKCPHGYSPALCITCLASGAGVFPPPPTDAPTIGTGPGTLSSEDISGAEGDEGDDDHHPGQQKTLNLEQAIAWLRAALPEIEEIPELLSLEDVYNHAAAVGMPKDGVPNEKAMTLATTLEKQLKVASPGLLVDLGASAASWCLEGVIAETAAAQSTALPPGATAAAPEISKDGLSPKTPGPAPAPQATITRKRKFRPLLREGIDGSFIEWLTNKLAFTFHLTQVSTEYDSKTVTVVGPANLKLLQEGSVSLSQCVPNLDAGRILVVDPKMQMVDKIFKEDMPKLKNSNSTLDIALLLQRPHFDRHMANISALLDFFVSQGPSVREPYAEFLQARFMITDGGMQAYTARGVLQCQRKHFMLFCFSATTAGSKWLDVADSNAIVPLSRLRRLAGPGPVTRTFRRLFDATPNSPIATALKGLPAVGYTVTELRSFAGRKTAQRTLFELVYSDIEPQRTKIATLLDQHPHCIQMEESTLGATTMIRLDTSPTGLELLLSRIKRLGESLVLSPKACLLAPSNGITPEMIRILVVAQNGEVLGDTERRGSRAKQAEPSQAEHALVCEQLSASNLGSEGTRSRWWLRL